MRKIKLNPGFTLLELMIVMVIVAIGIALAVPTYQNVTQRRHTTAQAEELAAFLAFTQSEAVKKNTPVSVELKYTNPNNWCIGAAETLTGCDCTGVGTACTIDGVFRTMSSTTQEKSSMRMPFVFDPVFAFDPIRGIKMDGDLAIHAFTLRSDNEKYELRVDIAPTGRVRICNSDNTKKVPGFKPCV